LQRPEDGVEHQTPMPSAPSVDEVESWEELRKTVNTDPRIPLEVRQKLADRKAMIMPLEVKFVEPVDPVVPKVMAPWSV
jgi:acyl-CoA thioesterase